MLIIVKKQIQASTLTTLGKDVYAISKFENKPNRISDDGGQKSSYFSVRINRRAQGTFF